MNLTLPKIDIAFKQLSNTFIERSERGIAILIIKDNTDRSFSYKKYTDVDDLNADEEKYTEENFQYLNDIMGLGVAELGVIRIDIQSSDPEEITAQTMDDALKIVGQKYKTGWIGTVGETADYEAINTWVKAKAKNNLTFRTICTGVDSPNHQYIVNVDGGNVIFADDRGQKELKHYIPSLIGIASVCNISRGMTYYVCSNLKEVEEVENVETALNAGKMVLINDYGVVRIGLGINSLTMFDNEETFEDMRYIDIIEAMTMIQDDIREVYKTKYVGACKNRLDNQMIFISAVNTYLDSLEELEVLDNAYDNVVDVNVKAQRKAWETVNAEAKTWDDTKVKNMAFKREVFLLGDIKILGAMENLALEIYTN